MTDLEGAASPRATGPRAAGPFSQQSLAWLVLALAAVAAIALISRHLGYIPMWDGRAYAECAVEASLHGLAPFYLRCWGHASHLYLGLLAISQLFDTGNATALIAVNAIIFAVGVAGFHRLTCVVFPDDAQRVDRALLSAVFMLQPPLLASVLQPGLDLPVLVGAIWTIALLIERRWAWTAVVGTAMMFSKETGVMLYGLFLGCWGLWSVQGPADKLRARWEELRASHVADRRCQHARQASKPLLHSPKAASTEGRQTVPFGRFQWSTPGGYATRTTPHGNQDRDSERHHNGFYVESPRNRRQR